MAAREPRLGTATLPDGTNVAYEVTGAGPYLLVVPGWLSHLEYGWAIPADRAFYQALASGRSLVRFDRPGCGLSDPYEGPRTLQLELDTIAAVVDAVGMESFDLMGWSMGAPVTVQWAADHPETVSNLVLYGGWADGSKIGDPTSRRILLELLASHWGLGSDLLTEIFGPEADAGTRQSIGEYQRAASSSESAVALLQLAYDLDVTSTLEDVRAPTLVVHRRADRAAPVEQGRALAAGIPGATLVEVEGRSHLPAIGDADAIVREVRKFLGLPALRRKADTGLTARQTEVAALVAEGLTNRDIAARLHITERSAESHVERIRLRLDFRSRTQIAAWYVGSGLGAGSAN